MGVSRRLRTPPSTVTGGLRATRPRRKNNEPGREEDEEGKNEGNKRGREEMVDRKEKIKAKQRRDN